MRCIAIDDERLVLDLLIDNISRIPYLDLVKEFRNPLEASEILQSEKIDLIFLDIQMPNINGLQFLNSLRNPPMIILVTAYPQYALDGYELNVIDYLVKPVAFERFLKACNKAKQLYDLKNRNSATEAIDHFFVHVEYASVKVKISEIVFIEGLKDYIKIYVTHATRPLLTKMSMKSIEEKLPNHLFMRVHKSFIVGIEKIKSIKRDFVCVEDKEIPIGEVYKDNIIKLLK